MQPPAHLPCHLHHFFRTIGKHGTHVESDIAERPEELECEGGKRHKHVLNGATMVPLVVTTFGKLGPSALGFLQSLAHVVSSTAVVDCGTWLRIAQQYLSFALVVRVCLNVLGKTFVMVLLCHASECGLFYVPSLF